jgi:hypothetical protein
MQAGRPLDDHPAVIIIAGDFLALAFTRHHIRAGLRAVIEARQPRSLIGEMLRGPGALEPAALLPEAIDLFFRDQPLDERERVIAVGQHACGARGVDFRRLAAEALADIDTAADRATITRAGALAQRAPFEDHRVDTVLRQFERRRQPGITAANDGHPRLMRHLRRLTNRRLIGLPPIRCGLEVGMENILVRHGTLTVPPQGRQVNVRSRLLHQCLSRPGIIHTPQKPASTRNTNAVSTYQGNIDPLPPRRRAYVAASNILETAYTEFL